MGDAVDRFRSTIGEQQWQRLLCRLAELNCQVKTRGIRSYREWDLITGYDCGEFWDWDLYFENIYMSYYGIHRYCRMNLERFLDTQVESGFIARNLVNPYLRDQFKPFLVQIALLGYRQSGDCRWLQGEYYDRLRRYLSYWFWYCDHDRNGLPVWDGAGHSGMDNQFRRAGDNGAVFCEGVDLACYLVRELDAMTLLAEALGAAEDAREYRAHAKALRELIAVTYWHEEDGFYYDRNERSGDVIRVRTVAGFLPLWADACDKAKAERLVHEHLLNEREFWLPYPVATWAKTEPDYYQQRIEDECNWRGPTWVPTNYMVFHGLRRYGHDELARELAYRTFDMVMSENDTREFYNAETGAGQGRNPFWGWSSLGYFMPLEWEMDYDPTDPATQIHPIAMEALGVAF